MNQSHSIDIQTARAVHGQHGCSRSVSAIVFICTISVRLILLNAIESLMNKRTKAGAQCAEFVNEHLLFGHFQGQD